MLTFEQKKAYIHSVDLKIEFAKDKMKSHLVSITALDASDRKETEEHISDYKDLYDYVRSLELMRCVCE